MSGYLPIPLQGNAVDPYAISLEYQKLLTAPVERGYTQAQTGLTQAQTTGEQIKNALGALNLQFRGQALGTAGNALSGQGAGPEPLPGQTEGSVYTPSGGGGGGGGSFQQVTGKLESGNDYAAVNEQGYSGKYQMGKGALAAAGIYQPAPREDMKAQGPGQWWGSFNIPGYDHPITYQQFLADPHAQDVAFGQHQQNLDHEIQSRGLNRYIGQTVAGVPITQDSLRSMMHGGGPEGTQRFIESGGQYNPADANGKNIASFGNRFAPGGGPAQRFSVGEQAAPPGQPYQVAQAGGGIQPPPGGGAGEPVSAGTGGPNALAQSNPMGTSAQGIVMPGTGVALPRQQVQLAYLSPDPSKALHDAMQDRRATLSQLAGGATDPRSWDQNVAQAWRMGYLTNADFQQLYGHFSPALKETVIRSMSSPETQVGYAQTLFGHGFDSGGEAGSPRADPYLKSGEAPVTVKEPVYGPPDASGHREVIGTREVTRSAPGYFSGPGAADAPGQAASAPQGGPPPQGVHVMGSDGNLWHVPVGPGAGAPTQAPQPGAQPAPGGSPPVGQPDTPPPVAPPGAPPGAPPTVPAPGGTATPPVAPAAAPPSAPGAQPLTGNVPPPPPGAIGAGNVELSPQAQAELDAQKAARTKTLEAPITTAQAVAQAHGVKLADAYGDEAAKVYTNSVAAPVTMERLQALQEAADLFRPGSSGQLRGDAWKRLQDTLQALGFKSPEWLNEKTTGYDVMNKLGSFLAANMVTAMGEKAASVFENIKQIQPGALQSSGGYQAVLSSVRMDALRMQQLGDFQEQWLGTHSNTVGMQAAFNKSHPVEVYSSWVIPHPVPTTTENGKVSVDTSKLQQGMVYRNAKGAFHVWTGVQFSPPGSEPRAMAPFQ